MAGGFRESRSFDDERWDSPRGADANGIAFSGPTLEQLVSVCPDPPVVPEMHTVRDPNQTFLIRPFAYDPSRPTREPAAIHAGRPYVDRSDHNHVRMPCSKDEQPRWQWTRLCILDLKQRCEAHVATVQDLKQTIETCARQRFDMHSLEQLINQLDDRSLFMSTVLSKMCSLAINVDIICSHPPPLLRVASNQSVTMSQWQAASLLTCAFFCLFPHRTDYKSKRGNGNFQNPNFNTLYAKGYPQQVEKLKCILHYFRRVTENMPIGTLTFRRYGLGQRASLPKWADSSKGLIPMHITASKKIEEIDCVLQVDFANRYIGGGVLSSGCVQEEIRFAICPEMLVSLLLCEAMEPDECIYLIGCEQYSSYEGYSRTFRFSGDHVDSKQRDAWGRKWCHVVAIDAVYFRHPSQQFDMKNIQRDLTKAYAGFHTRSKAFSIATGSWGCGAFNGDTQVKGIVQLMAASENTRPLIYAAYGDRKFASEFFHVYDHLIRQGARVSDLYRYLKVYCRLRPRASLFDFILHTPILSIRR